MGFGPGLFSLLKPSFLAALVLVSYHFLWHAFRELLPFSFWSMCQEHPVLGIGNYIWQLQRLGCRITCAHRHRNINIQFNPHQTGKPRTTDFLYQCSENWLWQLSCLVGIYIKKMLLCHKKKDFVILFSFVMQML